MSYELTRGRRGVIGLAALPFVGLVLLGAQTAKTSLPIQVWEKPLAPGLIYRMEVDPNVPRTLNAVRLSPQSPNLHWNAELAGTTINEDGTVKGRLTPSAMAAQTGALVAVNGDFFSYEHGAPIGQMVRNGELITTPARARAVFAWGPNDLGIGVASWKGTVSLNRNSEIPLENVNQPTGTNGIVLYTPAVGTALTAKPNLTAVLKMPDVVVSPSTEVVATFDYALPDAQKTSVPAGRALLVATGDKMAQLAGLRPGDKVTIRLKTEGFDWERFDNEVGGGPCLVRDGKVAIDAKEEGFNADFLARHPRTAIGRTADGDVWLAVVDGRQGSSVGATLEEMAETMRRLGCVDAINLDGGGSTALNVLGLTVNKPSDGVERPVSSGVLIFGPKPTVPVGKLKLVLAPKVAVNGTVQASVTLDGKLVENTDVLWTARGPAWIDQGGTLHALHSGKARVMARALGQPLEATIEVTGPPVPATKKIPAADK